jgi:hypothetical protein
MIPEPIQLTAQTASAFLASVMGRVSGGAGLVVFPSVLKASAEAMATVLRDHGFHMTVQVFDEAHFYQPDRIAASHGWVPSVDQAPPLLVLFGAQPWEQGFDKDYLVEIQAMQNREALLAAGHHIVFIDWPRGARRDQEIDLFARDVAHIYHKSITIDYDAMRQVNRTLMAAVKGGNDVHLTCPAGTDIRLSVADRQWLAEDCLLGKDEPAIYLPGGEIYVAAREDSAQGVVAFCFCGEARQAHFEAGILTRVTRSDGSSDTSLEEEFGAGSECLCEFGIGSNVWAPPWQLGTIYEKSAGTVHVAVGGNAHFGGAHDSPRHVDLIIRNPTVRLDGRTLTLPAPRWTEFKQKSEGDYR